MLEFEKFLHASFCKHTRCNLLSNELTRFQAKEDCEARRIVKDEIQSKAGVGQSKPKEDSEEGLADGGDASDESNDSDDDNNSEEEENRNITSKIWGGETYAQRRERNIAENKKLLDQVKAKYPVREPKKAETRKNKGCVL